MSQFRCLVLASLIFLSLSCARAARAQTEELPSASGVIPQAAKSSSNADADSGPVASVPNDPSAAHDASQTVQSDRSQPSLSPSGESSYKSSQDADRQKAEEQLKQQEHQRVMGVMAAFNTTINRDALPLSPGQKFQLFFKSQTDPWPFGLAAVIAGIDQANDSFPQYGQGMHGYAKRYGAEYGTAFIGNFWGNAVLTSWWREDPRYFQKGTGSNGSRFLWAAASTVWCKRDDGSWGPNYANVAGNLIGAAIANVYYPESERTVGDTITRGLTVSAQGIIGAEVIEFWPDIVRHYRKNHVAKIAQNAAQQDAQGVNREAARQ